MSDGLDKAQGPSERPLVVYLCGSGRSGSTILESSLAAMTGLVPLGEMRNGWRFALGEDGFCACGQPNSKCQFWQEVLQGLHPQTLSREIARIQASHFRMRSAFRVRAPSDRRYLQLLTTIYARASATSDDSPGVLDSSKHPAEARMLRTAQLDTRIVLLIRDPVDVITSLRRPKAQTGSQSERNMSQVGRTIAALSWICYTVGGLLAKPDSVVFYDRMCANPERTLDRVCAEIGIAPKAQRDHDIHHQIWGNPSRLEPSYDGIRIDKRRASQSTLADRMAGAVPRAFYHLLRLSYRDRQSTMT